MCLFFATLLLGPRAAGIIWWLVSPGRWDLTFGTAVVPVLGILLAPWTTLAWVAVAPGGIGVPGSLLIALGLLLDVGSTGGGYRSRR